MRRRVLNALLGAGLWLGAMAPAASAVEPIPGTPLPDEPPVTPLSERAVHALVADLDGDGVREVVAVDAAEELPGFAAVQAWWVDEDGSVQPSNQVRLRRSATFDDRLAIGNGIRIDDEAMTGVRIGEPAHLFTVRRDDREIILAAGMGANPELTSPCCLTIWEVVAGGDGAIELDLVAETNRIGFQLVVADLDGDGTDEMVVIESEASDEVAPLEVGLLQWNGAEYARSPQSFPGEGGCCPTLMAAGDSDGMDGEDVLVGDLMVVTDGSPDDPGVGDSGLRRLTLRQGALVLEAASIGGLFSARVLDLARGPAILTAVDDTAVQLWSWPRDEAIQLIDERLHRSGVPLAVFGTGADTTILIGHAPDPVSLLVLRGDLTGSETLGADPRAGVAAAIAQLSPAQDSSTFFGTIPGGVPDIPEAYVFAGRLVAPAANGSPSGNVEIREIALLPRFDLRGTAGPAGDWMAIFASPPMSPSTEAVLDVRQTLGQTRPLVLAATASVLTAEPAVGALEPTFIGVARDPQRPVNFIVGSEAVDVVIEGPPGSVVWWARDGSRQETTITADGTARIRLLEPARSEDEDGTQFIHGIALVTPSGHAYSGGWRIRVYRQPPDLGMNEDVPLLEFAPTVSGRTLPGSTITVNGQPGSVGPDGEFSESVQVGVVPSEVRIVVTDPVGNQTVRLVTRVWPLDYRQLPWVPIAVLLTVAAGAILFLRQPESRAGRHLTPEDESTFEEIGG